MTAEFFHRVKVLKKERAEISGSFLVFTKGIG
jgi:hypothetical protein